MKNPSSGLLCDKEPDLADLLMNRNRSGRGSIALEGSVYWGDGPCDESPERGAHPMSTYDSCSGCRG